MKLSFSAGIISNNKLYFSDNFSNALMMLDMKSQTMHFISSFPEENKTELLHKKAFEHSGKIFFVPFQGTNVHIYSPIDNRIDVLKIPKQVNERYAIADAAVVGNLIVIFPGNLSQPIITVNMDDLSVDSLGIIEHEYLNKRDRKSQAFKNISVKDNYVYSAILKSNYIVKLDVVNLHFELIETGVDNLATIMVADSGIWLSSQDDGVYLLDEGNDSLSFVSINSERKHNCPYLIIQYRNKVIAISTKGGDVFSYNENNNTFEKAGNSLVRLSEKIAFGNIYEGYDLCDEGIVLFPLANDEPWLLSSAGVIGQVHYQVDDDNQRKYKNNLFLHNIVKEGMDCGLSDYLNAIM